MAKTLKELGQNIATMARVKVPATFHGSTARNSRAIFLSIEQAVEDILRASEKWSQLTFEHLFTIVNMGDGKIDLPEDFDKIVFKSPWSISQNRPLIGPLTIPQWNSITAYVTDPRFTSFMLMRKGVDDRYDYLRVWGTMENEECILNYYTLNHAVFSQGERPSSRKFKSDTQFSLLDDDLIEIGGLAKFLRIIGRSYRDELEDFNDMLAERAAANYGTRSVSLNTRGRHGYPNEHYDNVYGDPCLVNLGRNVIP